MLCLFDFLAASRRIGDCLMNRSLKNQSLFQSEILRRGLDLSNVKQEVILRSDKESENVIYTVKSDPGDNQHVVSPFLTMEAHLPDLSLQPVQDQTYISLCSFPDNMAVKIDYSC